MKKTVVLLLVSLGLALSAAPSKRFETQFSQELKVVAFYPPGSNHGYFLPGETPKFRLELKNNTKQTLQAEFHTQVKYYNGDPAGTLPVLKMNLPPERVESLEFTVAEPRNYGYYILDTRIKANGKEIVATQSAFVKITPPPSVRDPFFGLDQNGVYPAMLEGYKRMGAGALGFSLHRPFLKNPEQDVIKELQTPYRQAFLNSDFTLVAHVSPYYDADGKAAERIRKGLFPLGDEETEHFREYIRQFATATKGRIRLWLLQREFDGYNTADLASYIILARIAYQEIKKVIPDGNVAVLGIMGNDYYQTTPKFNRSKMVLNDLKENFDMLCIDAYNGNWNRIIGDFPLPETGFRDFLTDTAKLSASYKRPGFVINAEHGYSYDYFSPFDSEEAVQVMQYTARRMIINKSVPCPYSSWHVASSAGIPYRIRNKKMDASKPIVDMGIGWKTIENQHFQNVNVPKMAGVAYANVARILAFTRPREEILIGSNLYCYTFSRQDGGSVAAIWSIDDSLKTIFNVPEDATLIDVMGNRSKLQKGVNELVLTQSPVYFEFKSDAGVIADSFRKIKISSLVPVIGEGYRISSTSAAIFLRNSENRSQKIILELPNKNSMEVDLAPLESKSIRTALPEDCSAEATGMIRMTDGRKIKINLDLGVETAVGISQEPKFDGSGAWFKSLKMNKLSAPENIWPKVAMIPEWGLFKLDGGDISARYAFAYDKKYFYLAVVVKDPKHLQRASGVNLWKEDSLQVVLSSRILPPVKLRNKREKISFGDSEINASLALTGKGKELFAYNNGKKPSGFVNWPSNVTRSEAKGETLYEIAIPWKELEITPVSGEGVRFGFIIMDNNHLENSTAKYWLAFSQGICGGQDPALLKTIILK